MTSVWSRQHAVQRTFGTTVSVSDSVSQVSNEEATCECHEKRASLRTNLSRSCYVYFQTHDVTSFVSILIRAITFSHNGPEDDVVRQVFALLSKRVQV